MGKNLEEMCRLVTGYGAWHIGDIQVSDGPHGVRAQEDGAKNNDSYEATCFPTASSVACSWNPDLIGQMAESIAQEAKELGVSVVLGPGINIKRSPLCGRNFEYYSEDPFLTGELATAYIGAMQEQGVGTSLKHFAGNNQETHRMTSNSMIDDRALHEIYLSAFEKAVKKAKPATVMASYNYINGLPACENSHLLTEILREKWGYEGLIMSDWGACVELPACVAAGMDVEMPDSCGNHYAQILEAVQSGKLPQETLETAVKRIERLNADYAGNILPEKSRKEVLAETRERHHDLAKRIEEESAVLLKNEEFLPLSKEIKEILIIGDMASTPRIQGGGSSHIHTERVISFVEAFEKRDIKVCYAKGYKNSTFHRSHRLEKEACEKVEDAKKRQIPVLFFGGLTEMAEGEGYDRESYELPLNQSILLEQLLKVNEDIGFVSISGAPYNMELPSKCKALLQMYLGGEAVAEACAGIVLGDTSPSGKLAESIPYRETDVPSYGYFGRQGEQKNHLDDVEYRESIFVGYRYYDTFRIPVRYCFGYGLSYTNFAYTDLKVHQDVQQNCRIIFAVENTGDTAGCEIAQVYVKNPETGDFRARRELRSFRKIHLQPGEKKEVEIMLDTGAFSVYQDSEFRVIGGEYEIQVGASLQDIRLSESICVEGVKLQCPLTINTSIPLSEEDFDAVYTYPRTCFSHTKPGEFTTKNSLRQMQPYSALARKWSRIGMLAARMLYFSKPFNDPEVRMMSEGILEGNIDSVCNQSGGMIKHSTIQRIVDSANRRAKNEG